MAFPNQNYKKLSLLQTYCHQWITTAGVTIIMIEIGIICGWSSPYSPNSSLKLTAEEVSWVISLINPGKFIGAILGSIFIAYLGTKRTLLLYVLPICVCWIITMFASSPIWLYLARLSGGLGMGMIHSCLALYVGEIALPEIRGAIMSAAVIGGCSIGAVVSSVCGSYLSMSTSAVIYLVPCVVLIILFLWLPDSPYWLVHTKNYKAAKRSIIWYQPSIDSNLELCAIRKLIASSNSQNFQEKIEKCFKAGPTRRSIVLIVVLFSLAELAGLYSAGFKMETILTRSGVTSMKPFNLVIYINASGILAMITSMYLVDKYGRRFLLIVSCIGVAIAQLCLGINSYLVSKNADIPHLQWLPIVSLFFFHNFHFIGLLSVRILILGEIFPWDIKNLAACIASLTGATWIFVRAKTYEPLVGLIGEDCVYWVQAAFAIVLVPYVYFVMPETKGKHLQEIQDDIMTQ